MNLTAIASTALVLGALTSVSLTIRNARGIDRYQVGPASVHPSVMVTLWLIWGTVWLVLCAILDYFLPTRIAVISLSVFVGVFALTSTVKR